LSDGRLPGVGYLVDARGLEPARARKGAPRKNLDIRDRLSSIKSEHTMNDEHYAQFSDLYTQKSFWPCPEADLPPLLPDELVEEIPGMLFRAELLDNYVCIHTWEIGRETPCGVWLHCGGAKKWRSRRNVHRFAQLTRQRAIAALLWRRSQSLQFAKERMVREVMAYLLAQSACNQVAICE
jgi:hypothetical protein